MLFGLKLKKEQMAVVTSAKILNHQKELTVLIRKLQAIRPLKLQADERTVC